MKRFCIVSYNNLYVLPYASVYIDAITKSGAQCDLLFWNRDKVESNRDDYSNCNLIPFNYELLTTSSKKNKLLGYVRSTLFFKKLLKQNDYNGIIFLQSHGAVFCTSVLSKKYKGKYIVDIRDYSLEQYSVFYNMEKKIIANSYANIISSPAYKEFLPEGDYVITHNHIPFPDESVHMVTHRENSHVNNPIKISFVGTVRFYEMDKKILSLFANDNRFQINYFGRGSEILKEYCEINNIQNVAFHGGFTQDKTIEFYKNTDLINNLYGNHNKFLDYALSNKLYHSAQLEIPILVCPDTYMEKVVCEFNIGFVFDVDKKSDVERLFKWYTEYDRNIFKLGCQKFIKKVVEDNSVYSQCIESFLNQ